MPAKLLLKVFSHWCLSDYSPFRELLTVLMSFRLTFYPKSPVPLFILVPPLLSTCDSYSIASVSPYSNMILLKLIHFNSSDFSHLAISWLSCVGSSQCIARSIHAFVFLPIFIFKIIYLNVCPCIDSAITGCCKYYFFTLMCISQVVELLHLRSHQCPWVFFPILWHIEYLCHLLDVRTSVWSSMSLFFCPFIFVWFGFMVHQQLWVI